MNWMCKISNTKGVPKEFHHQTAQPTRGTKSIIKITTLIGLILHLGRIGHMHFGEKIERL